LTFDITGWFLLGGEGEKFKTFLGNRKNEIWLIDDKK